MHTRISVEIQPNRDLGHTQIPESSYKYWVIVKLIEFS